MIRNRVFTGRCLSYAKRPGGAVRTGDTLGAGWSGGTRRSRWAGGAGGGGSGRSGRTLRTGGSGGSGGSRAGGSGGTGGTSRSGSTGGTSGAGRTWNGTGRWTGGRAAARRTAAGCALLLPFPLPVGGMIVIHDILLYPLGLWLCHMTVYAGNKKEVCGQKKDWQG